jgi:DNA invertase Pin-like site-specific DNA recombinase
MAVDLQQKVSANHLVRTAYIYVRQSTVRQVFENTESTKRQYALRDKALALGWAADDIIVIDSDLGQSGAQASDREGFQRLVADVGLGKAGIVLGLEVSRLARNSTDWHRLLEICALSDTLIADEDGLYNPAQFNDRLLLGLKGTMSEAELHMLKARLLGGQLSKAKRGELKFDLPVGFVYDAQDRVVLDPDQQVQKTIRLFFDTFSRTGSAYTTCRELNAQNILFPRKIRKGPHRGEIIWGTNVHSSALRLLHNPRYAGAYAYGRVRSKRLPSGGYAYHKTNRDEWITFMPEVHVGYISQQQFEENQRTLNSTSQALGLDRKKSPPREGSALIQGLAVCGKCGSRMTVRYHVRGGSTSPDYLCQSGNIERCESFRCQNISGAGVDKFISNLLVETVSPKVIDVAISVQDELQSRANDADGLRRKHVERLKYETELARRRYMRVDPDNRLVADSLEADWNQQLRLLSDAQEQYEKQRQELEKLLTEQQRAEIVALASNFKKVWTSAVTVDKDKKRIVRLIIEDVTLRKDSDGIQVDIRFKGGACRSAKLPLPLNAAQLRKTSPEVVKEIDRLSDSLTDTEIAERLNKRGFLSGEGNYFHPVAVRRIRAAYNLKSRYDRFRDKGYLTSKEVAKLLKVKMHKFFELRDSGVVRGCATTCRKDLLYPPLSSKEIKKIQSMLKEK